MARIGQNGAVYVPSELLNRSRRRQGVCAASRVEQEKRLFWFFGNGSRSNVQKVIALLFCLCAFLRRSNRVGWLIVTGTDGKNSVETFISLSPLCLNGRAPCQTAAVKATPPTGQEGGLGVCTGTCGGTSMAMAKSKSM